MRVDYYGRKLFEEIHTFDTSVGVAKQDLKKPNGATVATYTYGDTGDIVRELRETHGPVRRLSMMPTRSTSSPCSSSSTATTMR